MRVFSRAIIITTNECPQSLMIDQRLMLLQKNSRVIFTLAALLISISGCVDMEFNSVPGLPTTLDETETRSVMRDLSVSISTIEDAGISDMSIDEQRSVIVSELDKIAALIGELESQRLLEGTVQLDGSHQVIGKYLGTLALEVELAKGEVDDKNSDLFIAGQLAGVCRGCHEKLWPDS